ncbi:MAG: pyridine nucleotide-disulfide oxidoreductase, partial [Chloroflexota bacterium]|nr:pyridine nucleotide-disulfide oxidoreductase [Chloroflexota bacterium]
LCSSLKPGERIVLMGPTGAPTEICSGKNVLLAGRGLGNAVLFSLAGELRAHGNQVVYFAAYRTKDDVFHQDDIEAGCDQVVWSVESGELIQPRRPRDRSFQGNVVDAMLAYDRGQLGEMLFPFGAMDQMIAIGSHRMMAAVSATRHTELRGRINPYHVAIASINSPMQCMMKEVCGHCLQRHVDPQTGREAIVFSCFNQDQPMDFVDWDNLGERLRQNSVGEKLTNLWLAAVLPKQREAAGLA